MKTSVHFSSRTDSWETPQSFFDALNEEFHFTLDVCASDQNAKCARYFTPSDDGLAQTWAGVCWMNPPYGREIVKWMEKAFLSAERGATVVCLIPARTDTRWWHKFAVKGEIRYIKGRLKFGGHANPAPFPSALVIFKPKPLPDGIRKEFWGYGRLKRTKEFPLLANRKANCFLLDKDYYKEYFDDLPKPVQQELRKIEANWNN